MQLMQKLEQQLPVQLEFCMQSQLGSVVLQSCCSWHHHHMLMDLACIANQCDTESAMQFDPKQA